MRSGSSWTQHAQGRAKRGGNVLSTPAEFCPPRHRPGDHDLFVLRTARAFSGAPTGACIEFFPMQTVAGPASSRPTDPCSEARETVVAPAAGAQGRETLRFQSSQCSRLTRSPGPSETRDGFRRAHLLIRGCCSDSKTRLQLSRHLFSPRISTMTSEKKGGHGFSSPRSLSLCEDCLLRTSAVFIHTGYFWHISEPHRQTISSGDREKPTKMVLKLDI